MLTNIVDCDFDKLKIGQPVDVRVPGDRRRPAGADVQADLTPDAVP